MHGGRTELDGVCVSQKTADYVACVRAQGALGGERGSSLSAEAGYLGTRVAGASEVKERLERKYSVSTEAELLIIRDCGAQAGLAPTSGGVPVASATAPSITATSAATSPPTEPTTRPVTTCGSDPSPEVASFARRHPFTHAFPCYANAKEPKGDGRVVIYYDVTPAGRVVNAHEQVSGTVSSQMVTCIVNGFGLVPFPPSQCGGKQLAYPINIGKQQ